MLLQLFRAFAHGQKVHALAHSAGGRERRGIAAVVAEQALTALMVGKADIAVRALGRCGAGKTIHQRGVPAPVSGSATFQVAGAVDLSAKIAPASGDAGIPEALRGAFGSQALVLMPVGGDRPVLLHGTARGARGSAGGIGIEEAHLAALIAMLGDPTGLRVEVVRRRVQRAGWGGVQGQRQRGRQ